MTHVPRDTHVTKQRMAMRRNFPWSDFKKLCTPELSSSSSTSTALSPKNFEKRAHPNQTTTVSVLLSITNQKSNGIGYMIVLLIAVSCICNSHFEQFPQFSCHKMNLAVNYSNCSVYSAHSPKITPSILLQLNL